MTLKTLTGSIFLLLILSSNAHARNDYLNDGFYTCRQGDVRVELGYTDTTNPYSNASQTAQAEKNKAISERHAKNIRDKE